MRSGTNSARWRERPFVDYEEYGRIESLTASSFIVYTDIDRLERHMKEIAPEDGVVIDEFIAAVRACTRFEPPLEKAPEVMNLFDMLKMIVTNFSATAHALEVEQGLAHGLRQPFQEPAAPRSLPAAVHAGLSA